METEIDPKKLRAVPLDPAVAEQKVDPTEARKLRPLDYPGKLSIASERGVHGHFGGCAVKVFIGDVEQKINQWARENPFYLVVDAKFSGDAAILFYTRTLTDQEYQEFNEINQEAARIIQERRDTEAKLAAKQTEKVAKLQAETKSKADKELKELRRLAELGRHHEKNCRKEKDK